jgi:hypothetical protein
VKFDPEEVRNGLEIHAPELLSRVLQFEADLPTTAALMSAPNQNRFAHILIGHINKVESLPDRKPLWQDRQASFVADIDRIPLGVQRPSGFSPGDGHRHPGIQANSRADFLHPLFETQLLRKRHYHSP